MLLLAAPPLLAAPLLLPVSRSVSDLSRVVRGDAACSADAAYTPSCSRLAHRRAYIRISVHQVMYADLTRTFHNISVTSRIARSPSRYAFLPPSIRRATRGCVLVRTPMRRWGVCGVDWVGVVRTGREARIFCDCWVPSLAHLLVHRALEAV